MAPKYGAATKKAPPAKLSKRLVLNDWVLSLFEAPSTEALVDLVRDRESGGVDREWLGEDGVSYFHQRLTVARQPRALLSHDELLRHDERIVRHWRALTEPPERRDLVLKHFQYVALLFTEIYLERYFAKDKGERLLRDLNVFVETWNFGKEPQNQADAFALEDLNKLAFWMATGSGKTLLMHVNIAQYLDHLERAGRRHELNRIILLTPNEGLSRQHLEEFALSGIQADLFAKDGRTLFTGQAVEVIDIHKLAEEAGDKTVAVDAFEGNNLVLVDEGHRGASNAETGVWMERRRRLCEHGFSFEYSATFGQAIKAGGSRALVQEYGHCILFDYSYRYFHADGYGKEFRILNLAEDKNEDQRLLYMTGGLLAFLQQLLVYDRDRASLGPYGLEKPLWVFVGSRVTATTGKEELSDIDSILQFLHDFLQNDTAAKARIALLKSGTNSLVDTRNRNIFANRLTELFRDRTPEQVYRAALEHIFNAPGGGLLHIEQLKGPDADGEIELRVGDNAPFGVINVGDAAKVVKQSEAKGRQTGAGKDFGGSLFARLNSGESTVNVLIGAKKFTEGWSSWRVSTMGLMNVGKSEGSEIIQLFGRGVRLKGLGFSLKRSRHLTRPDGAKHPDRLELLETLNVFGIRAKYMETFREFLQEEGLPSDDEVEEFTLKVINHLEPGGKFENVHLWTLKLEEGKDFKRDAPKPVLEGAPHKHVLNHRVLVDWFPRIQSQRSKGLEAGDGAETKKEHRPLTRDHLAFLDFDAIWFELQRYKSEKAWYNLAIPREAPRALLETGGWYDLYIPPAELDFNDYGRVRTWHEVAVALLKKYIERYYTLCKSDWEKDYLKLDRLQHTDSNLEVTYRIRVPQAKTDLLDEVRTLEGEVAKGGVRPRSAGQLEVLNFDGHLYTPLLAINGAEMTPVSLNKGERDFVRHLEEYVREHAEALEGQEIYLLRNKSRGKGIGFFEAGNYYPDFILWVKHQDSEHVAFVDPKGLRNLNGLTDPKIALAKNIKAHQARLQAEQPGITLDAFLVSETAKQDTQWAEAVTPEQFDEWHVLFPNEDPAYIERLFGWIEGLPSAS